MNIIEVKINDEVKQITVTEGEHVVIAIVQVGQTHYHNPHTIVLKHDDYLEIEVKEEKKPPVGITPRYIHLEERLEEINNACERYVEAGLAIPTDWFAEKVIIETYLGGR